jgi:HSP90 family molecular chaperone
MPTDYQTIADENLRKYGTATGDYGPVLLAGIYSERTHFIYELLQNAEDALARRIRAYPNAQRPSGTVKFNLYPDRLEFRHCGRPFDEADVKGICGLVSSTARGDANRIGNFGIGFKSVYAYTTTPEVH